MSIEWISVGERLPDLKGWSAGIKHSDPVRVKTHRGAIRHAVLWTLDENKEWDYADGGRIQVDVTHWAPITPPTN